MTANNVSDAAVIPDLLDQLTEDGNLESVTNDEVYDTKQLYETMIRHSATPVIHSRKMHEYTKQ